MAPTQHFSASEEDLNWKTLLNFASLFGSCRSIIGRAQYSQSAAGPGYPPLYRSLRLFLYQYQWNLEVRTDR